MSSTTLKQLIARHWRVAALASASVGLSACVATTTPESSSSAMESSSSVVGSSSSVVSSSLSISSSSVVQSSSSLAASSSSEPEVLGEIIPRTSCPSAPPANKDVQVPGEYDLDISKDDIESMLTKMPTFEGAQWDLPWHMWEPTQASSSDELFPLIISLHGAWAGEPGGNESGPGSIRQDGVPYMLGSSNGLLTDANQAAYPAYMIFPHCLQSEGCHWSLGHEWAANSRANFQLGDSPSRVMSSVLELVQHMVDTYQVDPARIYVTGVSMGGGGTWDMAARNPGLLAAAIPLAGHTPASNLLQDTISSKLPIWAHGSNIDNNNPLRDTRSAVQHIDSSGGCGWVTEYQGIPHDHTLWQRIYLNPDLWPWLFAQRQPRDGDVQSSASSSSPSTGGANSSAPATGEGCVGAEYCNDFNDSGAVPSELMPSTANVSIVNGLSGKGLAIQSTSYAGTWIEAPKTPEMTKGYVKFDASLSGSGGGWWFLLVEHDTGSSASPNVDGGSRMRVEPFDGNNWLTWNRLSAGDTVSPNIYDPNQRSSSGNLSYGQWSCYELHFDESQDLLEVSIDGAVVDGLTLDNDASTGNDQRWQSAHGDNFDMNVNAVRIGYGGQSQGTITIDNLVVSESPIGCN